MRSLFLTFAICALLFSAGASAQQDTLKYRISLRDKAATVYSLSRPEEYLSEKAIVRRAKQHLAIDSTDLPVCKKYVDAIRRKGVTIVVTGKWDNFVTVSCKDSSVIARIAALPFVCSAMRVWEMPNVEKPQMATKRDSITNEVVRVDSLYYGPAYRQIQLSNGDKLHEAGFKGQGMTIAVIDAGFHNADRIEAMKNICVLGLKDFVNPSCDLFAESSHGMKVLSCMAMNQPHVMVGTAPEASYWLLRSEDEYSEQLVEQDYWAAAVEFADSVGADVVNTSLGYYTFDDKSENYKYRNLDGHYALMSRQAAKAADKGMIVVCSAGNAGGGSWKKITPPGDADNVITVGAIGKNGVLAPFSSIGNTADNRIKPDVVAVGLGSDVMDTNGVVGKASGTSFASPIMCGMVACLWQACPQLTAKQLIELVRQVGDRADFPDNIYGYGVPDLWKAYQTTLKH
ncbi:S8 family serine peptidase [uncultured Bacteroides sp.]|uniref:S8 family peptidase n=1 Tax=uncultured Bacteroides sp. TaxID=162156 RepID=UPI002AA6D9CD|nr:S8 family serine peptidase [uncultured Bacteroides sp.]